MRNGKPLYELHRHLDGSVRVETILDLGQQHNIDLPADTVEGLRPHAQVMEPVVGVMSFISKFHWMQQVLVDLDAVRRITIENVQDADAEGIDYIELRFSPVFMAEKSKLKPEQIVRAVCEGVAQAKSERDIQVKLIGILSRTYGVDSCWHELDAIFKGRGPDLVAIDLAGDEINYPGYLFIDHIRKAKDYGLAATIHAGEMSAESPHAELGLRNLWVAVSDMKAERLGHALRAVDDPALMDLIRERGVGIESCPTSNLQTMSIPSLATHPIKDFLERDVLVTLNTDDPGVSGITLESEYLVAERDIGLTSNQIERLQQNAVQVAFANI
ncbi:MAG: adenosine deaminase [Chloroflexota bacterium]